MWVVAKALYNLNLLWEILCRDSTAVVDTLLVSLTEYRADTRVCVLDKWAGVTVKVDTLAWIEEHCLLRINLEDKVLKCTKTNHCADLIGLLLGATIEFTELCRHLACSCNHLLYKVVSVNNSTLA